MERQFTQRARKGNTRVGTLTYKQYPAGRERGLLVVGGAEKARKVKGSIATWGCQRVERKGGQRWRKKAEIHEDLGSSRRLG